MDWISATIGLFGGGLFVYTLELYNKRGRLYIHDYSVSVATKERILTPQLTIDLMFINTSGHQRLVTDIRFNVNNGETELTSMIEGHNIAPSAIIEARSTKNLQYRLIVFIPFVTPLSPENEKAYVNVFYTINSKQYVIKINAAKFIYPIGQNDFYDEEDEV